MGKIISPRDGPIVAAINLTRLHGRRKGSLRYRTVVWIKKRRKERKGRVEEDKLEVEILMPRLTGR